jgi:hypothetical protein
MRCWCCFRRNSAQPWSVGCWWAKDRWRRIRLSLLSLFVKRTFLGFSFSSFTKIVHNALNRLFSTDTFCFFFSGFKPDRHFGFVRSAARIAASGTRSWSPECWSFADRWSRTSRSCLQSYQSFPVAKVDFLCIVSPSLPVFPKVRTADLLWNMS